MCGGLFCGACCGKDGKVRMCKICEGGYIRKGVCSSPVQSPTAGPSVPPIANDSDADLMLLDSDCGTPRGRLESSVSDQSPASQSGSPLATELASLQRELHNTKKELIRVRAQHKESNQKYIQLEEVIAKRQQVKDKQAQLTTEAAAQLTSETLRRKELFQSGKHHSRCCEICLNPYSLFSREHHCRRCYRSVCSRCTTSGGNSSSPNPSRNCGWCAARATLQSAPLIASAKKQTNVAMTWASFYESQRNLMLKHTQ